MAYLLCCIPTMLLKNGYPGSADCWMQANNFLKKKVNQFSLPTCSIFLKNTSKKTLKHLYSSIKEWHHLECLLKLNWELPAVKRMALITAVWKMINCILNQ